MALDQVQAVLPALTRNNAASLSDAQMASIKSRAKEFEQAMLGQMLGSMFETAKPDAQFSGGFGEDTFRSFLVDAISKQTVKAGGIGIAASVQRELIRAQERALSQPPAMANS